MKGSFNLESRGLSPVFGLSQHSKSNILFDVLFKFLHSLPNRFNSNNEPQFSKAMNSEACRIISSNLDTLHDYLVYFFLTIPFQSRKKVDFFQ